MTPRTNANPAWRKPDGNAGPQPSRRSVRWTCRRVDGRPVARRPVRHADGHRLRRRLRFSWVCCCRASSSSSWSALPCACSPIASHRLPVLAMRPAWAAFLASVGLLAITRAIATAAPASRSRRSAAAVPQRRPLPARPGQPDELGISQGDLGAFRTVAEGYAGSLCS